MTTSKTLSALPTDEPVNISRNQMTLLMMESYKKSSTSAEEIMCLREVAKLNSLYEQAPQSVTLINIQQNIDKLEVMSDEELLKLSGNDQTMFERAGQLTLSSEDDETLDVRTEDDKGVLIEDAQFEEVSE